jgi:hypothetical protein
MTIKTKFNIQQTVFVMYDNKIHESEISIIETVTDFYGTKTEYKIKIYDISKGYIIKRVTECEIFATKEELIKSL